MIRFLLYGLGLYAAYRFFKPRPVFFQDRDGSDAIGDEPPAEADLIKDPQCGAYFLKQRGVGADIQGERLYFCSELCRDTYLDGHRSG